MVLAPYRRRCDAFPEPDIRDDFNAIKRFAGEDYDRARYYDFDPDYLIEMEPHVQHYEIG